jgi:hypothetical protein
MKLKMLNIMKNVLSKLVVTVVVFVMAACGDDDSPIKEVETFENEIKTGEITTDETWTADRIYELDGRVIVTSGVTLTIEAGTIIKGQEGEAENASVLIVARGGKINANGTADKPIIFTSVLDNIVLGQSNSTLGKTNNETWGGIIILGSAPISAKQGDFEASIEGIPANEVYGKYGGSVIDDNSGTLKYVSIRFGGITIGEGNEINGLTLGGVGNGTTIDQVEVFATLDDGIEFFGGTVNVSNVVVAWQGDDGIDIDQNYAGTITNFVVTHGAGVGTDEGLEIDGPEGTASNGLFTLKNGSIISDGDGSAADFKSKAQGTLDNVKFSGYDGGATLKFRTSMNDFCGDTKSDAFLFLTQDSPKLVVTGSEFTGVKVYTKSYADGANEDTDAPCDLKATDQADAEAKAASTIATGADLSVFGWTAAVEAGVL